MNAKECLKKSGICLVKFIISILTFAIICFFIAFFTIHIIYADQLSALYKDLSVTALMTLAVWTYVITIALLPYALATLISKMYAIQDYKLFMIFGCVSGLFGALVLTSLLQEFILWRCAVLVILSTLAGGAYYFVYNRLRRIFGQG